MASIQSLLKSIDEMFEQEDKKRRQKPKNGRKESVTE